MSWDSAQYLKFERERTQPSIDLIGRIALGDPETILDVGCGPGNSTERLKRRYPNAAVYGVDNSEEMLSAAREKYPEIRFGYCDASRDLGKLGESYDIVFSNACIQWIPDHPRLLREMTRLLKSGGVLAVQVPMNYDEPIHRIIGEVIRSEKWRGRLGEPRIFHTLSSEAYYDLLSEIAPDFSMWETVYFHRMKSHGDILEWYGGTGLRPYLDRLSPEEGEDFKADLLREVKKAYPKQANGEIIFRFPRLFFTAVKGDI
ncbi:MAG: methyltransferase domain-containing protein [Bacteroides sp.]|nr:methyltransferase domain-containing protein [Eubacterium sp.]MCM1418883.1 methyltransferase domain-containing protein [Roseburia sp.]MCM1463372.1 methyltransferase domain-containing protein [Bacteroides sp.]